MDIFIDFYLKFPYLISLMKEMQFSLKRFSREKNYTIKTDHCSFLFNEHEPKHEVSII